MKNNGNDKEADNESILSTVLRESFLHWRHIENMRQGYTAVWAAIVAGVLAFISQTEGFLENFASVPPLIFLILITSLGLLTSIRLGSNIKPCEYNIREVLERVKLDEYDPTKWWGKGITKHFRLRRIFVLSYLVTLIFLISLVILIFATALRHN